MPDRMTPRERWLAALQCQPVDRLPFWPKIGNAYAMHQREPFRSMSASELHQWIGSDEHVGGPSCVKIIRQETRVEQREKDGVRTTTFHTPAGMLTSADGFDPVSRSWHPREFPVKRVRDLEAMCWMFSDAQCAFDADQFERATAQIRDLGERCIATTSLGVSPLMDWIQHLAGIEEGLLMLKDAPEEVGALFDHMHRLLCRRAEITAERSPYSIIYSVEKGDLLEITHDFDQQAVVFSHMDYEGFVSLVKLLYEKHLIELAAFKSHTPLGEAVLPDDFESEQPFDTSIRLKQVLEPKERSSWL